jgi:hypothetical protein
MEHDEISATQVRVPAPTRGRATVVTRYGAAQAVVLHPEDFMSIERIIDTYLAQPPYDATASDLAVRGHELANEREGGDYDFDGLAAALDAE